MKIDNSWQVLNEVCEKGVILRRPNQLCLALQWTCRWAFSYLFNCSSIFGFFFHPFFSRWGFLFFFFFHLSFSRWGVLPWDERAWSWVLVDVWPSCDSSRCPSPPRHPRWAWLCPSQVSSLSQSHLQNNYISYTSSLLSSPFYCLNILIFILIFIFLSFSFVFNINYFFITIGFSHIFLVGIFVRCFLNFPGTVFSFSHVTSFF